MTELFIFSGTVNTEKDVNRRTRNFKLSSNLKKIVNPKVLGFGERAC